MDAALEDEARYLHWCFFGRAAGARIVERYVAANEACLAGGHSALLEKIVARRLDPEAIELVLRGKLPLLTQKIQILFYLAECQSDYYEYFVSQKAGRSAALLALAGSLLKTAYKYVKGAYLVRRHRLV